MTRNKLLQLIRESRDLVKTASPEQKIRLLKLIKESYAKLKEDTTEQLPWILIENEDKEDVLDPETEQLMSYAKKHYPDSHSKQQAFFKYITRALKHSEQDDKEQNTEISKLASAIEKLRQDFTKMKLSETIDYLEEK